jgi:uncharacterized protein YeaO (DUF488 family)
MSRGPRGLVSSVSTSRPRGLGRHEGTRRRIWPRGLTKEHASVDVWLKDIAPSACLRTWFGHKPEALA